MTLPPEVRRRIEQRIHRGENSHAIARDEACSPTTVRQIRREIGAPSLNPREAGRIRVRQKVQKTPSITPAAEDPAVALYRAEKARRAKVMA